MCALFGAVPSLLVPLWYSVKRKRRHERESWWKWCCSLCGHCCPNPRNNSQSRTDHAHSPFPVLASSAFFFFCFRRGFLLAVMATTVIKSPAVMDETRHCLSSYFHLLCQKEIGDSLLLLVNHYFRHRSTTSNNLFRVALFLFLSLFATQLYFILFIFFF